MYPQLKAVNSKPTTANRQPFLKLLTFNFLLLTFFTFNTGWGQSISNYSFSSNTTSSLEDLSSGATDLLTGNQDDAASSVTAIGFDFYFGGVRYTHFSANSNGQILLHTSSGATAISGTSITGYAANTPRLLAMSGDNEVNAGVRFKLIGTTPGSRKLVIEWRQFYVSFTTITNAGNMQAWIDEITGKITYVYGEIYNSNSSIQNRGIAIAFSNTNTTAGYVTVAASPSFTASSTLTTNAFAAGSGTSTGSPLIANLGTSNASARRAYIFSPTATTSPTNLSFTNVALTSYTLNWIDNSSAELGYVIYRSTDNVNWTYETTTSANATTYNSTGLSPSTTYYWQVYALRESLGTALTGAQATSTCPSYSGTMSVGPSSATFTNLTTAISTLTACGYTGNIILELQSGYTSTGETFPLTFGTGLGSGSNKTITIRPATGATGLSITSSNTTATIDLNGASYIIFDGRPGGTGSTSQLTISNSSTTTGGAAIRFVNDANNNTVRYATVTSSFSSATMGSIWFSTTTGSNGNDNNTIEYCTIDGGAASTASPTTTVRNGIYAVGSTTTTAVNNSGNTIQYCNFPNFFVTGATLTVNAILISSGNTGWTIDNNSFYQTASRTVTTGAITWNAINISNTSGNGFTVTNNKIGGDGPNAGVTTSKFSFAGNLANVFNGILLSVGTTTATIVNSNLIANISLTANGSAGTFAGIQITAGNANIGQTALNGNTIGSTSVSATSTSAASIELRLSTATNAVHHGILSSSSGTVNISFNTIGGVFLFTSSANSLASTFHAIRATAGTNTISNNTIGSTTNANSINSNVGRDLSSNAGALNGIIVSSSGTNNISSNTIANLSYNPVVGTGPTTAYTVRGIIVSAGTNTISQNTIYNLSNVSANNGTIGSASVIGVSLTSTTAGQTVSRNTIYSLSNSSAAAAEISVLGIHYSGPTSGTNVIERNLVYGLSVSAATASNLFGLYIAAGGATGARNIIRNNMIAVGSGVSGGHSVNGIYTGPSFNNIYHNTVFIDGSNVTGSTATYAYYSATTSARIIQNNIFINARSNGTGTGKHYAIREAGTTGLTSNYNIYRATGTGAVLSAITTTDYTTIAAWITASSQDANSSTSNPCLANPTNATPNLKLTNCSGAGSPANATGVAVASVTDDYDGETRSLTTPDIGADEGDYGVPASITIDGNTSATATAFTTTYGSASASQSFAIAGSNLTADISVGAVTGFEYSIDNGSNWGTTRTITQSGGNASATLLVRLAATAAVSGTYNGLSINLTSTGATTRTISTASTGNAVSAKGLTIDGLTAAGKTYDGTTTASVSGTAAYSGLQNGESFSVSTTGTLAWVFSSANAGSRTVSLSSGSYNTPSSNYTVTQPSLSATIAKADAVIITAPTASAITQGQALSSSNLSGGSATPSGGTFSFTDPTIVPSSTGTYTADITYTPATGDQTNYNNAIGTTSVLVNDASTPAITVIGTLAALSTTYGTASSTTSFTVSGSALTNNITITPPSGFEVSTSIGSGYSTTSISLTQSGGSVSTTTVYVRLAATTAAGSYSGDITVSSTGATPKTITTVSSTVSQKSLTITGITGSNKEYDRTTSASFTGSASYSGLVNGESFSVTGTPSATFATATAGDGKTITVSGYSAPSGNYSLTQPTLLTGNISKKALTISSAAASNKTYDGNTNATITGSLSGVISPDAVTLVGTGTFASANVADGISVTSTSTLSGADAENYSLTQPTSLTANISKANQTITALTTPVTKVLSDAPYSVATTASSGLTVTYSSNNTSVATVASDGTVTIQGLGSATITASQGGNSNYNPAFSVTQALTVNLNPTMSATPSSLAAFSATSGTASTAQAFTVSGSNLVANITVTAPTGFEVSQTAGGGSGYAATQTLTQSSGSVSAIVYVRMTTSATGTPSGNVALTSTSASTVNVAVSGTVIAVCNPVSTTIFSENMGTPTGTTPISSATFQNSPTLTFSDGGQTNPAEVRITNTSSGYTGASGEGNIRFSAIQDSPYGFSIEGIDASQYSSLTLDYGYSKESSSVHATFSVDYWNGTTWVSVANTSSALFTQSATASAVWYAAKQLSLPSGAQINNLKIRFVESGGTGTNSIRIDDVVLKGLPLCPASISSGGGPLTSLSTTFGTASSPTSFTLTGSNLTTTISIAALSGFEFNNPSVNSTYSSTLSGISATGPTTINVRLSASANPGSYSGNIVCSSGSTSLNIPMPSGTISATAPGAPTINSISPDNQQLSVNFTAGSTGGSNITNYQYSTDGGTSWRNRASGTTASPLVITTLSTDGTTALTNGVAYNIQIRAVNEIGFGTATASVSATPNAPTAPDAPTIGTATAGNGQATVTFTAPASNGGSAITGYTVTSNPGGLTASGNASSTSLMVTGLTNGTAYTFTVTATNGVGTGAASTASNSVTPYGTVYYLKSGGSVGTLADWGTNAAGTAESPAPPLNTAGITWNINNGDATLDVAWALGSGSKVVVGDGTTGRTLTIPSGFALTGTVDVAASSSLNIANSNIPTFGTLNASSTIRYSGSSAQTVTATTYPNLRISTTGGNATAGGAISVTSLLTIDNGSTFSMSTSALSGSSLTSSGTGTLITQNTTATPIPTGRTWSFGVNYSSSSGQTVVAGSYADLNLTGGNRTLINGGTINISGTYTPGAGTLTVTGNTINFNGADGQTIPAGTYNNITSSNNTRTLANGTIRIAGSFTPGSGNYTIGTSTVEFNGTDASVGGSSVRLVIPVVPVASGSNYYNLTYSGTNTAGAVIAGSMSVANNLSVSGTRDFALTNGTARTLTVNGNVTVSGTARLNFTTPSGATASGTLDLKGNLSYTSTNSNSSTTLAAVTNGTIVFSGSGTVASPQTFTTGLPDDFAYTNYTINSGTVVQFNQNLLLTGSGTITPNDYRGKVTVNGTLNLQSNTITSSGANAIFIINSGGTLITSNSLGVNAISSTNLTRTFDPGANYIFNGSTAQVTGSGLTAANNITINNAAGVTLSANTSVTGTMDFQNGRLTNNGFTLTLSNAPTGTSSSRYIVADATGTVTFNSVTTARTLPIGTATSYAPITVTAPSSTNYTTYVTSSLPCTATEPTKVVNLAWGLSGANTPTSVVFQWNASDQAASFAPGSTCELARYNTACPYTTTSIGAASGSGPYTLTASSGLSSTNNIYVIGNAYSVYFASPVATAATSITNNSFTANWDAVSNATGYRLDVLSDQLNNLVSWNFPNNPDDNIADGGISANLSQTISTVGGTGTIGYIPVASSTTSAASTNTWTSGSGSKYWQVSFSTTGYSNLRFSSAQRSSSTGPRDFKVQYRIGSGGTWVDITGASVTVANNWSTGVLANITLPSVCDNQSSVFLRWIMTSNTTADGTGSVAGPGTSAIDGILVEGFAPTPIAGYNNLLVSGTSQSVTGLSANTTYYYRVRAESQNSTSANSNTITVKTCSAAPSATTSITYCQNATATALSATGSNLLWYTQASGGTGSATAPTPSTASSGTTSYWVSQTESGTCESPRTKIDVVVRPSFTPGAISTTGQTICTAGTPSSIGSATAASGGDENITYSWRSSADGYTNNISGASATGATYTPPAGLTETTSYRRYAVDGTCNTTPEVSTGTWTVTVTPCYTVTYDVNGGSGTVPSTTTHFAGATVTAAATVGPLTKTGVTFAGWNTAANGSGTFYAAGVGTFTINANTILYARWVAGQAAPGYTIWNGGTGNWSTGSNWSTGTTPSTNDLIYIGEGTPSLNTNFTVANNLQIAEQGGLIINPGVTLTISGDADFGDRPVTLKSSATTTASIGQVNSLTGATNVTVERYLNGKRKWRALTSPLIGSATIYNSWQNGGSTTVPNTGAIIWGPGSPAGEDGTTGLYRGGVSNSLLRFQNGGNAWIAVTNTRSATLLNANQDDYNAYMLFFTGPYNKSGTFIASGTAASTLSATGTLRTGNVTYNLSNISGGGWHMVGNPYASSITLRENAISNLNLAGGYIWNTTVAGVGGYTPIPLSDVTTIQSGQAFFVYAEPGGGSISFAETDKVSASSAALFRTEEPVANGDVQIALNKTTAGVTELYDVAIVNYKSRTEVGLPKLAQFYENMSIYQDNTDYGMTTRTLKNGEDVIQLRLWQMNEAAYQFNIDLRAMRLPAGSKAVLVDAFLNKETALSTTEANKVDFDVTNNAGSSGQRFRIVLRRASDIPVTSTDAPRFNIYPNPVEKGSAMQLEFRNKLAGKYTVTLFTIAGVQVQQSIVTHGGGNGVQSIAVSSRLSSGAYIAEITGANGVKEKMKVVVE